MGLFHTFLGMKKSLFFPDEGRGYSANFPSLLAHFKCETSAGAATVQVSA
jgi:hypothetical protein